jgi:hypothetical protein
MINSNEISTVFPIGSRVRSMPSPRGPVEMDGSIGEVTASGHNGVTIVWDDAGYYAGERTEARTETIEAMLICPVGPPMQSAIQKIG